MVMYLLLVTGTRLCVPVLEYFRLMLNTSMASKSQLRENDVDIYILDHSLREHPILTELREHTVANVPKSKMLSDITQVQLFQMLLKTLNATQCIEVGTYTGYNALSCALTIPDNGIVYALDISSEYLSHGVPFFEKAKVSHKIHQMIAPASESLDKLLNEGKANQIDFIYIDADKTGYEVYYEKCLKLLRPGGIVVLDNMLMPYRVIYANLSEDHNRQTDAVYVRDLTLKIKSDERVDTSFLKIGDGALFCRKR